ncbi:MAG TPA: Ig-like domain-containing protein, partial [Candidatus Gracilibacteria bacterium]|nr:Ig-like domain-containing protein [Candidatus Gracilibacteria bacterium]
FKNIAITPSLDQKWSGEISIDPKDPLTVILKPIPALKAQTPYTIELKPGILSLDEKHESAEKFEIKFTTN